MKKNFKKLTAIMTACALAFSMTACSGSSETEIKAANSNSEEKAADTAKKSDGSFPSETITLVCPFSAGGGTDIGARNMATALSKAVGR